MTFSINPSTVDAVQVTDILVAVQGKWSALPAWLLKAYQTETILFSVNSVVVRSSAGPESVGVIGDWLVCSSTGVITVSHWADFTSAYTPTGGLAQPVATPPSGLIVP